ncbi:MAG: hypothetical protein SGILL_005062 [Bacillariaceae sp.]
MSNLLPDLASWALGGGAGNANDDSNNNGDDGNNNNADNPPPPEPAVTDEEMRARRLARMEALQKQQQASAGKADDTSQPMEVEKTPSPKNAPSAATATPMETDSPRVAKKAKETHTSKTPSPMAAAAKKKASPSILDPAKKQRRKTELILKKTLGITLGSKQTDTSCIPIDIGDDGNGPITVETIADVMSTRVALSKEDLAKTSPPQKPLISYLAMVHRKASEEAKTLRQNANQAEKNATMLAVLDEIATQAVNYAASSLMEPDLLDQASDSRDQFFYAIVGNTADPTASITFGVTGLASSFYHQVCDELHSQDAAAFDTVIAGLGVKLMEQLKKCDNLESSVNVSLGANGATATTSPLGLVSGLQAICSHKKAALAITQLPDFLLPAEGSPAANEVVRPPLPQGPDLLRMLAGGQKPYKKRSGVGLDKNTLLGLVFRISTPKNNPAFSPTGIMRQSMSAVESATNSQRQQLLIYQNALNQLIKSFIKAGADARGQVMQWFFDCMLVNPGATAMRPDQTKVSSQALLLNTSVILLKLCEPFVLDEKKHHLIDPGFVSSVKDNKGIFPTSGDDALPRLGENTDGTAPEYAPKNAFIPQCFFLAARSLALGIVPMLSQHDNLLRHISHSAWELRNSNRDMQSDPQLSMMMARQRSNEVALFQEEMVVDTLRFCNLMAKVLCDMNDESLRHMPEFLVDNVCDILTSIADLKPKVLRGMEFRYVFSVVVKLLGPKYAEMVRNYNLRARLGDVVYELFLPPEVEDSRRRNDVPSSVSCDPLKGGQPYLTSNEAAIETLAASLLLLYGEVEHTGYYQKMTHRRKIQSLIKYLWDSKEHRPSFQKITQNKESFIIFANGIMNETDSLIGTVMQKLPLIKQDQDTMANATTWANMSEEEQSILSSRLSDNEREVKSALPLCNKTIQMLGYLNTDEHIRTLFLHPDLRERLVKTLNHVLQKIIGGKGMELKVKDPEQYDFRPKELLRDLCAIFALFASNEVFQESCAEHNCKPEDLRSAVSKCHKYNLLTGESMSAFDVLPDAVAKALEKVAADEAMLGDIPDEFTDLFTFNLMRDPVILPSGKIVDRASIKQHLLNNTIDPYSREPMTIDDVKPAVELKAKIDAWLASKRAGS